jgi:hypothetical protein
MKKIIALIFVVFAVALTGCSETEGKSAEKSNFVKVEDNYNWYIVYHKETKVMYAVSRGSYNCGNFTLLVNADGTPMIWEGE